MVSAKDLAAFRRGLCTCPSVVTLVDTVSWMAVTTWINLGTYSNMFNPAPTVWCPRQHFASISHLLWRPRVRSGVLTQQVTELDGLLLERGGSGGHLWTLGTLKGALTKGDRGASSPAG
jgi:hypothetical protein